MWPFRRRESDQELVERLIREKGARPIEGMEVPDIDALNRAGQQNWIVYQRAQERLLKAGSD